MEQLITNFHDSSKGERIRRSKGKPNSHAPCHSCLSTWRLGWFSAAMRHPTPTTNGTSICMMRHFLSAKGLAHMSPKEKKRCQLYTRSLSYEQTTVTTHSCTEKEISFKQLSSIVQSISISISTLISVSIFINKCIDVAGFQPLAELAPCRRNKGLQGCGLRAPWLAHVLKLSGRSNPIDTAHGNKYNSDHCLTNVEIGWQQLSVDKSHIPRILN